MYIVKKHSGKSVYAWRVYAIYDRNGQKIQKQLTAFKSRDIAEAYRLTLESKEDAFLNFLNVFKGLGNRS